MKRQTRKRTSEQSGLTLPTATLKRQKTVTFAQDIIAPKPGYSPQTPTAQKLFQRVNYTPVTALELYQKVQLETKNGHRQASDDERCPICFCDLFDNDLLTKPELEISNYSMEQINGKGLDQVVLMSKCTDHCFHRECLESQMATAEYLKCAVCSITYGVRTGDQPEGSMEWKITNTKCDGYTQKTWQIYYKFGAGSKNGKKYNGDSRTGYIPDTPEGREVLALLIKAFKRKLTFTVGYSVVRAQDNCIVWNGIHHKTRTSGGSSNYGYPDATYFSRVKNELADKGVVLESSDEMPVKCGQINC